MVDPIARKVSKGTKDAQKLAEMAEKASNELEANAKPLLKAILQTVDAVTKASRKLLGQQFAVIRKAQDLAMSRAMFTWLEEKIVAHYNDSLESDSNGVGEAVKTVARIPGLSSWDVNKSRLLKGLSVDAMHPGTNKRMTIGKLDPSEDQYSGEKGCYVWLENIDAMQKAQVEQWTAAAKDDTEDKSTKGDKAEGGTKSESKENGNDGDIATGGRSSWSDMLKQGMNVLERAISAANAFDDNTLHSTCNSLMQQCARDIEAAIVTCKNKRAAAIAARNKDPMTPEKARELRAALNKAANKADPDATAATGTEG